MLLDTSPMLLHSIDDGFDERSEKSSQLEQEGSGNPFKLLVDLTVACPITRCITALHPPVVAEESQQYD